MTKRLFSYLCGMLFIIMQFSHALILQAIEEEARYHYDDALDHLPEKQKNLLIRGQQAWLQYRNLRYEIHETIYQGNIDQCKTVLTYQYNIFLKLLSPNQIDMMRFVNQQIHESINEFQSQNPQDSNKNFDVRINNKLNNQYNQFHQSLNLDDQIILHKSYVSWLSYQNQVCLLLNSQNLVTYNYCAAKLSLDIISDMHNYLTY